MLSKRSLLLAGVLLLALPWGSASASGRYSIGVQIGVPYYRPYYSPYYYYHRPVVPVYVAPPPVYVQPAPVYVQPAPAPVYQPELQPAPVQPTARTVETRGDEVDSCLQHLSNPDERVRADMAMRLGRMKARRAAEPLERVLASDRSPEVRDAAARALGLLGQPASLPALQRAAQADDDRGVRNSAQFAVEVIRSR